MAWNVERNFVENKSKGAVLRLPCPRCEGSTNHKVLSSIEEDGRECEEGHWSIAWLDRYQIVQCQGCDTVSFRHESWFSEDQSSDPNDDAITKEALYPKRDRNSIRLKDFWNVSSNIRRIYGEVIDCFNNDCATLCAAGLRALVEAICADQGVVDGPVKRGEKTERKGSLEGKIGGLQERGFLTESAATSLHEHRFLGNGAVHELTRPSVEELKLAIGIIEHMIEHLYEIPQMAGILSAKRARKNA